MVKHIQQNIKRLYTRIDQNHPKEKEMQEGKVEALHIAEEREKQRQGRKGKKSPIKCRVPENIKEI